MKNSKPVTRLQDSRTRYFDNKWTDFAANWHKRFTGQRH